MIDSQGSVAVLVLGAGVTVCATILYGCYVLFDRLQTRAETMRGYRRWTAIGLAAGIGLVALLVFWFCAERRVDAVARIESLSPGAQRLEPLFCGRFGERGTLAAGPTVALVMDLHAPRRQLLNRLMR